MIFFFFWLIWQTAGGLLCCCHFKSSRTDPYIRMHSMFCLSQLFTFLFTWTLTKTGVSTFCKVQYASKSNSIWTLFETRLHACAALIQISVEHEIMQHYSTEANETSEWQKVQTVHPPSERRGNENTQLGYGRKRALEPNRNINISDNTNQSILTWNCRNWFGHFRYNKAIQCMFYELLTLKKTCSGDCCVIRDISKCNSLWMMRKPTSLIFAASWKHFRNIFSRT